MGRGVTDKYLRCWHWGERECEQSRVRPFLLQWKGSQFLFIHFLFLLEKMGFSHCHRALELYPRSAFLCSRFHCPWCPGVAFASLSLSPFTPAPHLADVFREKKKLECIRKQMVMLILLSKVLESTWLIYLLMVLLQNPETFLLRKTEALLFPLNS